jgi:predicted lipoprotein with Yx(FWY)xxD motif
MKWMRAITVAAAGLALGGIAACGQAVPVQGTADQQQQVEPANAAEPAQAEAASKLSVSNAGELGQIVVDGKGMSVYRFDKDTGKPSKSNCVADCAVAWPPILVTGDPAAIQVEGVDNSLLGAVAREDGSMQLTIAGWPQYNYAKDTKPGDVLGQGVGGTWFATTPAGKKAANAAAAAKSVALVVMNVKPLGPIVTNRDGMTLYRFDKDVAKPEPKSNCDGECAQKWPPLLVPDGATFELTGVDKSMVGSVTRSDGTKQVTVGNWPVYLFSGDSKPCDINGQGLGGVWFALKATGAKAL